MEKVFLASYFAGVTAQFQDFIKSKAITDREIVFIPTAGNVEDYTDYIDEGRAALAAMGYQVDELDVASESQAAAIAKIKAAQIIYISGGNTFYLLQELKRKQLLPVINEKINAGVPYIGESAGAIIMAPNIEYNSLMDDTSVAPDLTDYSALAQTDFYTLPHFEEEPFVEADEKIIATYQNQINLVPINNSQAIISDGETYQIV